MSKAKQTNQMHKILTKKKNCPAGAASISSSFNNLDLTTNTAEFSPVINQLPADPAESSELSELLEYVNFATPHSFEANRFPRPELTAQTPSKSSCKTPKPKDNTYMATNGTSASTHHNESC